MHAPVAPPNFWVDFKLATYPSVTGAHHSISAASVGWFCYALLWAVILLVSFSGWGRGAARLFRVGQIPASVACSLGIAVVVFLGGILNLLDALYVPVLFALVGIGFVLYLWLRAERPESYRWKSFWTQMPTTARVLLVAALVILALRVAATVGLGMFNVSDDSAAYLVFPQKLLATHHFATDPFSDRRVISSLGGGYLLQAFFIAATTLSQIAMADRTLGLVLLAVALFDIGTLFELSPLQIALLELLAFLVPQATMNLTFIMLPTSLLLAMVWLIYQSEGNKERIRWEHALLAGAIGGAIIALKSTYLPIVGAYVFFPYLLIGWRTKNVRTLGLPLIAGISSMVVLLAWMFAMKATSGTYLFPVFGTGVDYASYGWFQKAEKFGSARSIIKVFLQAIPLLILAGIQFAAGARERRARLNLSILIASIIAIVAFNYKSGADFIWRYNFPQFFCAVIVFYVASGSMLRGQPSSNRVRAAFYIGILSMLGMMFYYDAAGHNHEPFRQMRSEIKDYRTSLSASLTGRSIASPRITREYGAMEQSLQDQGTALENVGRPYLFNFRKHRIYVMDWPGAASPPPGWPLGESSNRLVRYLAQNSVRYVVYDYRYAAWEDAGSCISLERSRLYSRELYRLFWIAVLSNHQLDLLRAGYRSIYDDGTIAVIDLDRPVPNAPADGAPWTLKTNKRDLCSEVISRYLKNPLPAHPE